MSVYKHELKIIVMQIQHVNSHNDLLPYLDKAKITFLLLYQSGSEKNECAYTNLSQAADQVGENINMLAADVREVRNIHTRYDITTAPALLEFEGKSFKRAIKGCQSVEHYISFMRHKVFRPQHQQDRPKKNVIVYTTQSCPHCTHLKHYLNSNHVPFKEVDVSKDQKLAQELVRKSGQQGVPQTEINGRIIVGFDKQKIDQILQIHAS